MDPLVLLNNPQVADKMLALAGVAAGLGQQDVRELSQRRIPVWGVAAAGLAVGFALGIWTATKLPPQWIVRERSTR
jgi:uncharacterized membrane protein YfcA